MSTLHLVSHTHWDREWYQTFQQFRLRLVHLVDKLLAVLAADPAYRHFMLDGQTIVLEDYLEVRPERRGELEEHIRSGRILIGPWYVLPDLFLVSPEALVRNLLEGAALCRDFGGRMEIGYVPDPFGQIGQLPQILLGFGIETAAFRRGLSTEPPEVWWQAPDGSRVLAAYLRDGYDNAAWAPAANPEVFAREMQRLADSLRAVSASQHLLLMQGTDHLEPSAATPSAVAYCNRVWEEDRILHSTLPAYFNALRAEVEAGTLTAPTVSGELRDPRKHHLLPGVLSTRAWIKQRNHASERLLERWAEPFGALADRLAPADPLTSPRLAHPEAPLRRAWKLLLQNQPHDSICGCSIDQVHEEMRPRFDQADQIGEELTRQALEALAERADTRAEDGAAATAVVFNPAASRQSTPVRLSLFLPAGADWLEARADGRTMICQGEAGERQVFQAVQLSPAEMRAAAAMLQGGQVFGLGLLDAAFQAAGGQAAVDLILAPGHHPEEAQIAAWEARLNDLLADERIENFSVTARSPQQFTLTWLAEDLPALGYRTFQLYPAAPPEQRAETPAEGTQIETNRYRLELLPDATLRLTDKLDGRVFDGLARLSDERDLGDTYNFTPAEGDLPLAARLLSARRENGPFGPALRYLLEITRGEERITASLRAHLPLKAARLELDIEVDNQARGHRLRLHFPLRGAQSGYTGGHYHTYPRALSVPLPYQEGWSEQPRPELPQRLFSGLLSAEGGLAAAAPGIYEVELAKTAEGGDLALTLLRCVGMLSKPDLSNRQGGAGPSLATPAAQEIGRHTFRLALIPHSGAWQEAWPLAESFDLPPRALAGPGGRGELPAEASFFTLSGWHFSSLKKAQDGRGLILRGWVSQDGQAGLSTPLTFARVTRCRLDESPLEEVPLNGGRLRLAVRAGEVLTLRLE